MHALDAVLDHVAVAVPDPAEAWSRWREQLCGRPVYNGDNGTFRFSQLRFAGGGKLELLAPSAGRPSAGGFVQRFLDRHGSAIHHLTLKVPALRPAVAALRDAGLDVVDVDTSNPHWQEAFLRPSQVGGLVVQVAFSPFEDTDWAQRSNVVPQEPLADGPRLLGPTLRHPDLAEAEDLWTLLGAKVDRERTGLRCQWPDSPLDVVVTEGAPAGPTVLRFASAPALPAEPGLGPAVEPHEA